MAYLMYSDNEEKLTQILREYLESHKPYFVELEGIIGEVKNGIIEVKLRVYDGFVTDIITTSLKRKKFIDNEKAEITKDRQQGQRG